MATQGSPRLGKYQAGGTPPTHFSLVWPDEVTSSKGRPRAIFATGGARKQVLLTSPGRYALPPTVP